MKVWLLKALSAIEATLRSLPLVGVPSMMLYSEGMVKCVKIGVFWVVALLGHSYCIANMRMYCLLLYILQVSLVP